ncbi:HAD family hydrolase [Pseudolysinimonas sp.]|uniref:HAD family hydrolase n=1 Tax=Pseudolysinimonas sp. TaxID=2680009 RepID=UPI003F80586E
MTDLPVEDRWLVALDIDGTVLHEDGTLADRVVEAVQRVAAAGHEVMLATGRSVSLTLPILERLGLLSEHVVSANGAIVLGRDPEAPVGYSRVHVDTFDPSEVLTTIREHLAGASYAVEDEEGLFRYAGSFPDGALAANSEQVAFDELLGLPATRVVVISPDHGTEEFLAVVDRMGLHQVTYNVGWTAWLDIAPDGVNKATGLEIVRERLGIPRENTLVIGDGRNDIDMLRWAGVGIAMGQAPDEVIAASDRVTGTDLEDGVATALDEAFPA